MNVEAAHQHAPLIAPKENNLPLANVNSDRSLTTWKIIGIAAAILGGGTAGTLVAVLVSTTTVAAGMPILALAAIGFVGGTAVATALIAGGVFLNYLLFHTPQRRVNELEHEVPNLLRPFIADPKDAVYANCVTDLAQLIEENPVGTVIDNDTLDNIIRLVDCARFSVAYPDAYLQHAKQLIKLMDRLKEELGDENAEKAFNNAELIPARVKLPCQELTDDYIEYLIVQAKQHAASQKLLEALDDIANEARKGLVMDEQHIHDQFNINNLLGAIPQDQIEKRRQEVRQVINAAYVARELKKKGGLATGGELEEKLFRLLDIDIPPDSPYYNKEFIYDIVQQIIQSQMTEQAMHEPLDKIKTLVKRCGLRARLQAVGIVDERQVLKFEHAYAAYERQRLELKEMQEQVVLQVPLQLQGEIYKPVIRYLIAPLFNHVWLKSASSLLNTKFIGIMPAFKDPSVDLEAFDSLIEQHFFSKVRRMLPQLRERWNAAQPALTDDLFLRNLVEFFLKWGEFMRVPILQGAEDANEALSDGICWGICQQMILEVMDNPNASVEDIAHNLRISKENRFLQGVHSANVKLADRCQLLPESVGRKRKVIEHLGMILYSNPKWKEFTDEPCLPPEEGGVIPQIVEESLSQALELRLDQLDAVAANGWMRISLTAKGSGHTIMLNLNEAAPSAAIMDPNFGFFSFIRDGEDYETGKVRCMEFLQDLLDLEYEDTLKMSISLYHPRN